MKLKCIHCDEKPVMFVEHGTAERILGENGEVHDEAIYFSSEDGYWIEDGPIDAYCGHCGNKVVDDEFIEYCKELLADEDWKQNYMKQKSKQALQVIEAKLKSYGGLRI